MKAITQRGRSGLPIKKKARGFMCGCGGSKSVSVSDGSDKSSTVTSATTTRSSTTTTMTNKTAPPTAAPSSFSSSSCYMDTDDADTSVASTPSVAALLLQLGEMERSLRALGGGDGIGKNGGRRSQAGWHRRSVSEGGSGGAGRVEESVAVVKESADPLGDFRRSMLRMIVEKEIVGGGELRELLHRFLSLNSPRHHHLILRAFAEIWDEVFAGYERTPDLLSHHKTHSHANGTPYELSS